MKKSGQLISSEVSVLGLEVVTSSHLHRLSPVYVHLGVSLGVHISS